MMKHSKLYQEICSIENLELAHAKASKGKSDYQDVIKVNNNKDLKLRRLREQLLNENYEIGESDYTYKKLLDKGKERDLYKLDYYPHRIVQWAIMNKCYSRFKKHYIYDTYAALPGKGIHNLKKKLEHCLRTDKEGTKYCLKLDISKFYPNIDNNILLSNLKNIIRETDVYNLFKKIIKSRGDKGLPIGSLLSQYLANYYLSCFDHYCKEKLRLKYYFRYMDDIVICHKDKLALHDIFNKIKDYLEGRLALQIKRNWQIFPIDSSSLDYIGYRFYHNKTILRKSIYKKAKRAFLGNNERSQASYFGWCCHANLSKFLKSYYKLNKNNMESLLV